MTKDMIQGFEADEGASWLLHSLRNPIRSTRRQAVIAVNVGLARCLSPSVPGSGEQIVATLSHQMVA